MGFVRNWVKRVFGRTSAGEARGSGSAGAGSDRESAAVSEVSAELVELLDRKQRAHPEDLDWRNSVVDLMKVAGLDLESAYDARRRLAIDWGYPRHEAEAGSSAELNRWMHGEILRRLSADGEAFSPRS